jgi:uncharacterized protein YcfJ
MKLISRITAVSILGLASLILVVSPANASGNANSYGNSRAVFDYAKVLSVKPVVRYVTVTTPVRECWDEEQTYAARKHSPGRVGKTLVGAIIGGVVGNQFGGGHGNNAATVAGSLLGAAIGNSAGRNTPDYYETRYSRPVRRCETNYQSREEERIEGYQVVYAYNGRKYSTRTPFDPGKRIRIRVDITPAAY